MITFLYVVFGVCSWQVIAAGMALAVFPLFRLHLKSEIAWGFSRLVAPMVILWTCLCFSSWFKLAPLSFLTLGLCVFLITAGVYGYSWHRSDEPLLSWQVIRGFLSFELLYLGLFLFIAAVTATSPDVIDSERMYDTALWTALWVQNKFPIMEPWLSGHVSLYYIFGFFPLVAIGKLSGQSPTVSYNFALAMTFVNYICSLFLFFRHLKWKAGLALASGILIAFGGDFKSLVVIATRIATGSLTPIHGIGERFFTEFPLYSFFSGYVHPSFLSLFLVVCLIILVTDCIQQKERTIKADIGFVIFSAIISAFLAATNPWESVVGWSLVAGSILYTWKYRPKEFSCGLIVLYVGLYYLLKMPFSGAESSSRPTPSLLHSGHLVIDLILARGLFLFPIFWVIFEKRLTPRWWLLSILPGIALNSGRFFSLAVVVICGSAFLAKKEDRLSPPLALALFGAVIMCCCEFVSIKEIGLGEFNTVLKFYHVIWTVWGLAALWTLLVAWNSQGRIRPYVRVAVVTWILLMTPYSLRELRWRFFLQGNFGPLDGLNYLKIHLGKDEVDLIRWTQRATLRKELSGVLLEAPGTAYTLHGRFSTATGLGSYVAWPSHLHWYQFVFDKDELAARVHFAEDVYSGEWFTGQESCLFIANRLQDEDIDYVVGGALESKDYGSKGIQGLKTCLPAIASIGSSVLLKTRIP